MSTALQSAVRTPGSVALRSIRHVARLQRIDEQGKAIAARQAQGHPLCPAIVSGNATYWDLSRLYR